MAERGTRAVALFRPRYRHNVFSKLHPVLFVEASPSSMRYSISLRRTDVVSTLRGPRALSSGRAGGGKQPQFTCGVKRNRLRAGPAAGTACPGQTGLCVTRAKVSPPGAFRRPGRKGRAGGIHFRRKQGPKRAGPVSVQCDQRRRAVVVPRRRNETGAA